MKQNLNQLRSSRWVIAVGFAALTAVGCAGGPLTAREKGAGIGAVGGAAAGGELEIPATVTSEALAVHHIVAHEIHVDLHKFTVKSLTAKDLRELWVDTRRRAGDVRNIRSWRDGHQCRVSHALLHLFTECIPIEAAFAVNVHFYFAVGRELIKRIDW